jgi:hypothetical protein
MEYERCEKNKCANNIESLSLYLCTLENKDSTKRLRHSEND